MRKTLSLLIVLLGVVGSVAADKLPQDRSVLTGRLSNGITYYIRYNSTPHGQASFHLVHNVGSLAEEPSEYGAAHFLEHLMFQGTRRFPDRQMVRMLERGGVLYGHNINARTSDNETVYMLTGVPTRDEAFLDSCMMVMAEWSHAATLEAEKIDSERSVILSEMEMRNTPDNLMQRQWADSLLRGSRYEQHDVIGTSEFVRTVRPEQLRRFYTQWHRPDLEAVIVVGDFDVKQMERRLRRIMGEVPKAKGKCPLKDPYQFCRVPDQSDVRFVPVRNGQSGSNTVIVINRLNDAAMETKQTVDYLRFNIIVRLFNLLAEKRAAEKVAEPGSPLGGASIVVSPLKRGYLTYQLGAAVKNGDETRTLRQLLMEESRLATEGFTADELEWGRGELRRELVRNAQYSNTDHELIAKQIESAYLDGEPLLSAEEYARLGRQLLDELTLDQLNGQVKQWSQTPNKTIVVIGPTTPDGLTVSDVKDLMERTAGLDYSLFPYVMPQRPVASALMDSMPRRTTIVDEVITPLGKQWTLANGVKVVYHFVESDKSKVCLRAVRRGGTNLYDVDRLPAAEQTSTWVVSAGAGAFSSQQMYEQMQLHNLSLNISINAFSDQMVGMAQPDEAESLFQLMHLYLTQPHLDPALLDAIRRQSILLNVNNALQDTIRMMRSGYSPRTLLRNQDYFDKATVDLAIQTWRERFGHPALFTYVVTGNISEVEARRLVESYLSFEADLSQQADSVVLRENHLRQSMSRVVRMNLGREVATVVCSFNLDGEPTVADQIACRVLAQAFQTRCMNNIREKGGGVYAINVNGVYESLPTGHYEVDVDLNCQPQDAERLKARILEEMENMVRTGLTSDEYLSSIRSLALKVGADNDNAETWAQHIVDSIISDAPILTLSAYEATAPSLQPSDIHDFLRRMSTDGYTIDVVFKSTSRQE